MVVIAGAAAAPVIPGPAADSVTEANLEYDIVHCKKQQQQQQQQTTTPTLLAMMAVVAVVAVVARNCRNGCALDQRLLLWFLLSWFNSI